MAQRTKFLVIIVGFTSVIGAFTLSGQSLSGQSYTRDLFSEPSISSRNRPPVTASPSGIGTHTPQAGIPFEITVSLDRSGYVIGDRVVYEMLVKHTGSTPFQLPWARDPEVVRGAARIETASFILWFKDEAFGLQVVGGAENTLYGSRTIPSSMLELKPGDTLRVRARSEWFLMSGFPAPPEDGWLRDLSVRAQIQVDGVSDLNSLVNSVNAVTVQLGQR